MLESAPHPVPSPNWITELSDAGPWCAAPLQRGVGRSGRFVGAHNGPCTLPTSVRHLSLFWLESELVFQEASILVKGESPEPWQNQVEAVDQKVGSRASPLRDQISELLVHGEVCVEEIEGLERQARAL